MKIIFINRLKTQSSKQAVKGADNEEKVVYNLIEEAGNKGIWIRDIRVRSNLANTQLTKVLKSLEGKKVIKAVKCVNVGTIYIFFVENCIYRTYLELKSFKSFRHLRKKFTCCTIWNQIDLSLVEHGIKTKILSQNLLIF